MCLQGSLKGASVAVVEAFWGLVGEVDWRGEPQMGQEGVQDSSRGFGLALRMVMLLRRIWGV